jgi:endonuclease YncB( thermonuclease family)
MKKYTIIFFIIVVVAFLISNYIENYKDYIVSEVIDGDTFKTKDGKTIRLIGINAPETGEKCYQEAKDKLEELLYKKKIRLERDASNKDDYGRLLRYVYVDDLFVNSEMIRLGLARFEEIEPNEKYSELFLDLENKARRAGRCIWE